MFLAEKSTGRMIEVLDTKTLFDPNESSVRGCLHFGEEAQDPEDFKKDGLNFPSGESLPLCWTDPDYRRR